MQRLVRISPPVQPVGAAAGSPPTGASPQSSSSIAAARSPTLGGAPLPAGLACRRQDLQQVLQLLRRRPSPRCLADGSCCRAALLAEQLWSCALHDVPMLQAAVQRAAVRDTRLCAQAARLCRRCPAAPRPPPRALCRWPWWRRPSPSSRPRRPSSSPPRRSKPPRAPLTSGSCWACWAGLPPPRPAPRQPQLALLQAALGSRSPPAAWQLRAGGLPAQRQSATARQRTPRLGLRCRAFRRRRLCSPAPAMRAQTLRMFVQISRQAGRRRSHSRSRTRRTRRAPANAAAQGSQQPWRACCSSSARPCARSAPRQRQRPSHKSSTMHRAVLLTRRARVPGSPPQRQPRRLRARPGSLATTHHHRCA